jgi:hypothetical protein
VYGLNGVVIGYDPGGRGAHGLAAVLVEGGRPRSISMRTVGTTEEAVAFVEGTSDVIALGVDTLTCWSTGPGGWRPADRWLRERYKEVASSVQSPNYLSGAMVVNGMAFLLAARQRLPEIFVTETHPKVLLFHLAETKYDYVGSKELMDKALARALGVPVAPANEHEWDAALSACAALGGLTGRWKRDLHALSAMPGERIVCPCGATRYCWPD